MGRTGAVFLGPTLTMAASDEKTIAAEGVR
jgi:hypothetical protein